MAGAKYVQLASKPDTDEDILTSKPRGKWSETCFQKSLLSLGLILLYFSLSIGLTFYQRWLLKEFRYPLTVVMYHLAVKWVLAAAARAVRLGVSGPPPALTLATSLRRVAPAGLAGAVDVGFSNWGLELVTISLYTMTKSTTVIFILAFAVALGLEEKSWWLAGVVAAIAGGLAMFTYKATQWDALGFALLLVASAAAGLRWTCAQLLAQRARLGLHNPLHMVYHLQPWMFLSLLPFTLLFEGWGCFTHLAALPRARLPPTLLRVSAGAVLAFAMELSEFLVVAHTSSLTLSVAGVLKEMCILALAVEVGGDRLSAVNAAGLALCLLGVSAHVAHRLRLSRTPASPHAHTAAVADRECRRAGGECDEPLLAEGEVGSREGSPLRTGGPGALTDHPRRGDDTLT